MLKDFVFTVLTHPAGIIATVSVIVFAEMFIAKKWFLTFTPKISNVSLRKGVNLLLGMVTSFSLALAEMWIICDTVGSALNWFYVGLVTLGVTFAYLALEKVFTDAEIDAFGKSLVEMLSKSKKFEGKLTGQHIAHITNEFVKFTTGIDNTAKEKVKTEKDKVADDVIAKISAIVADGEVTAEEKAEADKLLAGKTYPANDVFAKYEHIINGK